MFAYCRNNPVSRIDAYGTADFSYRFGDDTPWDDMIPNNMGRGSSPGGSPSGSPSGGTPVGSTSSGVGTQAANPLSNITYTPKVVSQMSGSDFHGFSKIVDNYGNYGTQTQITGGDAKIYTRLEIKGNYLGYDGSFVYIWDVNGVCNHRFFERD